ncbi:MAG: ArsR family transcriptional regulator [Halanaeroarchaeum sp.]
MPGPDAAELATSIKEAFSLVGNEVRATILTTLAVGEDDSVRTPTATGSGTAEPTFSFSELRERVDPSMDSSQFNYHLQRLVPTFVVKDEDGYRLHPRGIKLYRAIAAGTYTREAVLAPIEAGFDCHFCNSPVVGRYEDDRFTIRCPTCRHRYASHLLPPSVVDDKTDLFRRVDRVTRATLSAVADGVCPTCLNELDGDLLAAEDADVEDVHLDVVVARHCSRCGDRWFASVGEMLVHDAELIGFASERGLDVTTTPTWEMPFVATDRHMTVESRDPWRLTLAVPVAGDILSLTVDASLSVVESKIES